jgi:hypothetical protein
VAVEVIIILIIIKLIIIIIIPTQIIIIIIKIFLVADLMGDVGTVRLSVIERKIVGRKNGNKELGTQLRIQLQQV